MKFYISPELALRRLAVASVLTASGDPDEWETDIVEEDEYDPSATDEA